MEQMNSWGLFVKVPTDFYRDDTMSEALAGDPMASAVRACYICLLTLSLDTGTNGLLVDAHNGRPLTVTQIAYRIRMSETEVSHAIDILLSIGYLAIDDNGVCFITAYNATQMHRDTPEEIAEKAEARKVDQRERYQARKAQKNAKKRKKPEKAVSSETPDEETAADAEESDLDVIFEALCKVYPRQYDLTDKSRNEAKKAWLELNLSSEDYFVLFRSIKEAIVSKEPPFDRDERYIPGIVKYVTDYIPEVVYD